MVGTSAAVSVGNPLKTLEEESSDKTLEKETLALERETHKGIQRNAISETEASKCKNSKSWTKMRHG